MANKKYEVSSHRIDQLEILLKNEAALPSFGFTSNNNNNNDDSLDTSLKDAIVGSNPSLDVPRCKSCSGELLRGPLSIICVYCARPQHIDNHSISFNSTLAFQCFLHSLRLDPHETIGIPPVGGTQSGISGRGSIKEDEMPLSEFLDLQLKCGDHLRGFGLKDEEQLPGKRYLSLIGVDIDEILSQESADHGSGVTNEQVVVNPEIENEEFRVLGERNRSLFENAQPSEVAMKSGEGVNDDSFADWGAEFQSASISDPDHGKYENTSSSSNDPSGSNLNVSSSHNWSNTESSGQPFEFKRSDENISVDSSVDWLPADEQHSVKKDSINIKNENKDDDSLDEWGDFRMSRNDTIIQDEPISTAGPATDTSDGLGISDSFHDLSKDIQSQKDNYTVPDDAWNDLLVPSSGGDILSQNNSDKLELYVGTGAVGKETGLALLDGAFLEHQDAHVESTHNKISDQSDSLGLWGNEVHLNSIVDQIPGKESMSPADEGITKLDNSFDLWNDFRGSDNQRATNTEVADSKISTEGGNVFDVWNGSSGLILEKKEEQAGRLEVAGVNINGNRSESSGLWNDDSLDEWNDFTGSTDVMNSKPITNDDSLGAWNDFSSLMVAHENTRSNSTRASEHQAVVEDGNLFSSWIDYGSSGLQTGYSSVGPNDTKTSSDINFQISSSSLENVGENSTIDAWGDFGGATSILEQQLQAPGAATSKTNLSSGDDDLFFGVGNNGKQSTSQPDSQLNMYEGKFMEEKFDSFAWGDFTSSSNPEADLNRSVNASIPDEKKAVQHGDLLAEWSSIVSSPNVHAGKDFGSGIGENPEYVETISSMPTDLPISMFSNQNGSAPVASMQSGVSDLVRVEHGDAKDDGYNEGKNISVSSSNEEMDVKASIAETLISEMHDLSFMLESSLSIPKSGT